MAVEPGGRADKLGNEYERLWVVKQLLLVLQGDAHSVLWEGTGDDERGVDVWVGYSDGARTGFQCRRQNGSKGNWFVSDLKDVLKNAEFQLGRDSRYKFAFVSSDQAPYLRDLIERTRRCSSDPEQYIAYLTTTSIKLQAEFDQICALFRADKTKAEDQQVIFNFLSRLEVCLFDDGKLGRSELRALARWTVDGNAGEVISTLEKFAIKQVGNEVYAKEIRDYLRARSFQPRDLSGDPQIQKGIETLQERFHKSLNPFLINGTLIKRPETEDILNRVLSADAPRIVCIHGKAGHGKSGVLYEFTKRLIEHGVPYLPLRLDRQYPTQNAENFGRTCGLPSSPGTCLKALAGNRKAIFILDQLDAIRWTSVHNPEAWDVFEELVEECLNHENLCVVVACRTSDFKENPRIKMWRQQQSKRVVEVKIGELPEKEIVEIINTRGVKWAQLSKKQKAILRSPANLFLWTQLETVKQPFRTTTDLMKAYWSDLWKRIGDMEVSTEKCKEVLDTLVEYMDKNGRLTAPNNLNPHLAKAQEALVSLNALTESNGSINFSHQGYLDYLVAHKVLSEIRTRNVDIVTWLKVTDQSLFKRDQLRNILTLLRDEDECTYCEALEEIIKSKDIRFHLKHLVLNLLGNIDQPLEGESQLVFGLLRDKEWERNIKDLVLWNRPQWFKELCEKGIIDNWLSSDDKEQIEPTMRLMGVILPECTEEIYKILRPLEKKARIWKEKIAGVLSWKFGLSEECDKLFAMRVRLIREGVLKPQFLHWEEIARKEPRKCILLFRVCISRLVDDYKRLAQDTTKDDLPKIECISWHDLDAISKAAEKEPKYTWKRLIRFWFSREQFIFDAMRIFHRYDDYEWDEELLRMREKLDLPLLLPALEKALTVAGQAYARNSVEEFINDFSAKYALLSKRLKRATMRALTEASDDYADRIVLWLSENPESFKLDSGYYISSWEPAERLIKRFSTVCSGNSIRKLEEKILCYKDAGVKRTHKQKLEIFRKYGAITCNEYGRTQYVLLSCIPKDRLSEKARSFLGEVERKFVRYGLHEARGGCGGGVTSPIPRDKLLLVTDREWLEIINRDWSSRRRRLKQMGPNHVGEASHEHFSDDFGHVAEQQPQRFAKLALRIPKGAYEGYLSRILRAMALTKPPDFLKQPEKDAWQPATGEQIEAVLDYVGYSDDRNQAVSFCDLLETRFDAKWPKRILNRLLNYATRHPDPEPETFPVEKVADNKEYVPDVVSSALNCVRGRAAMTMAKLLFEQPNSLSTFKDTISQLVNDASPAVRVAAMHVCLPILNINRDEAVAYFLEACDIPDERIFEGSYATRFISYAWHTHLEDLEPTIKRMAKSDNPEVAKIGSAWTTAIWLRTEKLEKLKDECCCGSKEQRKGAAEVAAHWLSEESDVEKHIALLRRFFEDEDSEVRNEASSCFRKEKRLHIPAVAQLAIDYVESNAFEDDPHTLFYGLDDYTGNLTTYAKSLFKAGEKCAGPLANKARNFATRIGVALMEYSKLMLRLYERTYRDSDKEVNEKCLSIWDKLLESGIVETRILEELEA